MLKTDICDLFGIEYPIIQGGWPTLPQPSLLQPSQMLAGWALSAAALQNRSGSGNRYA